MDYWHRDWKCPFFKWDEKLLVVCEGGRVIFPDEKAARDYFDRYCAHLPGWEGCCIAAVLSGFYERGGGSDGSDGRAAAKET